MMSSSTFTLPSLKSVLAPRPPKKGSSSGGGATGESGGAVVAQSARGLPRSLSTRVVANESGANTARVRGQPGKGYRPKELDLQRYRLDGETALPENSTLPKLKAKARPPPTAQRLWTPRDRTGPTAYHHICGWEPVPTSPPGTADKAKSRVPTYDLRSPPKRKHQVELKQKAESAKKENAVKDQLRFSRNKDNRNTLDTGRSLQGVPLTPVNMIVSLWRELVSQLQAPSGEKGSYARYKREQDEFSTLSHVDASGNRLRKNAKKFKRYFGLLSWDVLVQIIYFAFPPVSTHTFSLRPQLLRDRRTTSHLELTKRGGHIPPTVELIIKEETGVPSSGTDLLVSESEEKRKKRTELDVKAKDKEQEEGGSDVQDEDEEDEEEEEDTEEEKSKSKAAVEISSWNGEQDDPTTNKSCHRDYALGGEPRSHIKIVTPPSGGSEGNTCELFRAKYEFIQVELGIFIRESMAGTSLADLVRKMKRRNKSTTGRMKKLHSLKLHQHQQQVGKVENCDEATTRQTIDENSNIHLVKLSWEWDGQRRQHLSATSDRFKNHLFFIPSAAIGAVRASFKGGGDDDRLDIEKTSEVDCERKEGDDTVKELPQQQNDSERTSQQDSSSSSVIMMFSTVEGVFNDSQGVYSVKGSFETLT